MYTCTHAVEYNWATKKGNSSVCKSRDETGGHFAKCKKPDKDKYCIVSIIYGILKKKKKVEFIE